jgi:seryl-tRNA synthetase
MHGAERKERKRKLNAIHSRHKRERRQAEFGNLEGERRELEKEGAALNREAKRLEGLITSAQQQVSIYESKAQTESRATGPPLNATASPAPAAANGVDPMTVDVNRLVRDTLQRYTESTSTSHLPKLKDPP